MYVNYLDLSRRYWKLHKQEAFMPSDTHVYWCLVNAFNEKGSKQMWPEFLTYTDGALADLAGVNSKTLDKAVERLSSRGLITTTGKTKGGRKGVNYALTSPLTSPKNGEVVGEVSGEVDDEPAPTSPKNGKVSGEVNDQPAPTSPKNGEVNGQPIHQPLQQPLHQPTQKMERFYIYIESKQQTPNTNLVSTVLVANRDQAAARVFIGDQLALNIKKKKAPPSGAPPLPDPSPPRPGDPVGDGRLRKACLAYHNDNPTKYQPDMYRAFLAYWTAPVQNSTKKSEIGKELWETQKTWELAGRLSRWHQNNQKDEQRNKPNGARSADFLNRQRIAEPAKHGYGTL